MLFKNSVIEMFFGISLDVLLQTADVYKNRIFDQNEIVGDRLRTKIFQEIF